MLRAFFGYANRMGWTANYPFKSFPIESEAYGDPFFITITERDKLYDADIKDQQLSQVRDIFIFQCCIGCRYGDLVTLKHSNIIDGCIEYIAGKTKDHKPRIARIPLTKKANAIIARYNLPNGDLLPYLTIFQFDKLLKVLFKDQDLKRMVTVLDPRTRTSIQKSISAVASSHMARRVFIGGLYRAGVKNEIIASMSGHVENSKAFSRYYSIEKSDQQSAISLIE
jgi:site-specific recombinase XerD